MKPTYLLILMSFWGLSWVHAQSGTEVTAKKSRVSVPQGILEGTMGPDGVRAFKGIPYAAPPVGELRWKAPQPAKHWKGVRDAGHFGHQPMQAFIYHDMIFRADTMSEDCLYLNVWTPAKSDQEHLPVLVYFYGGGFMAGDGSEPRYDGESMAKKGIVTLTINYRLGIFGFFSLPGLSAESPHHASGDYGLLDQHAALEWVQKNIAAFGGDPRRVTIAGESAGSMSVCAQMASPLSKGLFAGAIGESGAVVGNLSPSPLATAEKNGQKFMTMTGVHSLDELRKIPADSLLTLASKPGTPRFGPTVDGFFLPASPTEIFNSGKQMKVPLLAGFNSAEVDYHSVLGAATPSPADYAAAIRRLYPDHADEVLTYYPGPTTQAVIGSATALASDRFIAYSTWKWMDLQSKTAGKPVYRYLYAHLLPPPRDPSENNPKRTGAPHASEIPYALGNLDLIRYYAWTPEDHEVSRIMQDYFADFIKAGDPNGGGLPHWPKLHGSPPKVMVLDTHPAAKEEQNQKRYQFLDTLFQK